MKYLMVGYNNKMKYSASLGKIGFGHSKSQTKIDSIGNRFRKSQSAFESEAKKLENYYFSSLITAYEHSDKTIPDPIKLLEAIKANETRLKESQLQTQELRLKLNSFAEMHQNTEKSLHSSEFKYDQVQTKKNFRTSAEVMSSNPGSNRINYLRFLSRLTVFKEKDILKFSQVKEESLLDAFFDLVQQVIKGLEANLSESKQSSETKLPVINQDEKFSKQPALRQKNKQEELLSNLDHLISVRKNLESENKQLHLSLLKANTTILNKTNIIEELSQKLDQMAQQKIKAGANQADITALRQQLAVETQRADRLEDQKAEIALELEQVKDQLHRMDKMTVSPRKKIRQSLSNFPSGKEEDEKLNESEDLSEKRLFEMKQKEIMLEDHKRQKQGMMRKHKMDLEGMVEQWRNYLKFTVDDMNEQIRKKDIEIASKNEEIEQLKAALTSK